MKTSFLTITLSLLTIFISCSEPNQSIIGKFEFVGHYEDGAGGTPVFSKENVREETRWMEITEIGAMNFWLGEEMLSNGSYEYQEQNKKLICDPKISDMNGSKVFLNYRVRFSGDTMFLKDVSRTDLYEGAWIRIE